MQTLTTQENLNCAVVREKSPELQGESCSV